MKFVWEMIDGYHWRLKVPGGWVFKVLEDVAHKSEYCGFSTSQDWRIATCFIPDPDHTWMIEQ